MIEDLVNFESYILNESNIQTYLKYKLNNTFENKKKLKIEEKKISIKTSSLFIPKENDSLFWCYYLIKNGDIQYEMLQNRNSLTTQQLKINLVTKLRDISAKKIIKMYKFDTIINIESNLANDAILSIKTFMTLCAVDNINIIFVSKKTYYELLTNDSETIYIIKLLDKDNGSLKYNKYYGYEIATKEILDDIRSNLYQVDSLNKPIKSLSAYTVPELLNIANKLAIETLNKETGKNKTKNELYELIIQYF